MGTDATFQLGDKVRIKADVPDDTLHPDFQVFRDSRLIGEIITEDEEGDGIVAAGFAGVGIEFPADELEPAEPTPPPTPDAQVEALREPLSDLSHEIWASWMRWIFTVGTFNADGAWWMPPSLAERWQRQMNTPYAELSEGEKDSDREQADKILAVIATQLQGDAP